MDIILPKQHLLNKAEDGLGCPVPFSVDPQIGWPSIVGSPN